MVKPPSLILDVTMAAGIGARQRVMRAAVTSQDAVARRSFPLQSLGGGDRGALSTRACT
jgi:hypothetical protein